MQNALKEPASRFGPVVSTSSPPRYSKPASARPVHIQQSNSKVAADNPGAELRYPSSTLPFLFKQGNLKLTSPASTISLPNALGLSKGPPRTSKGMKTSSALLNATTTINKRQQATSTAPPKVPPVAKKPTRSSKCTTLASAAEVVEAEAETEEVADTASLPVYNYALYTPKPTKSYIRTATEANNVLENMVGPLGFDLEWRVSKRKGVPHGPVAVVQIADQRRILILQTSAMRGVFPKKLKEILEDPTIIKTGVNVRGDAQKLYRDQKIKSQNLVELSWLSRQADSKLLRCGGKSNTRTLISLQKLTAAYLERDLVKSPVRIGNWESILDEEQLTYAANDAHSSVMLYHYFTNLAKAEKQTLRSALYTLNVNVNGEVVSGASEAERTDEMDAFEVEAQASTPSVPPEAPGSVPLPPPTATRAKKVLSRTTVPKPPILTPSTTSAATTTTSRKKPPAIAVSRRPPEIIELSDSDSDLDQIAEAMEAYTPVRSSKPRLTEMELHQLAEAMKDPHSFASTSSMSTLTSTLAALRKSTRLSDVELRKLAEEFQAFNLNGDRMEGVEEERHPARRGSPGSEAAVTTKMASGPFGAVPFGPPRVSRTMAYALGVRK